MSDDTISSLAQQFKSDVHRVLNKSSEDFQSYANQIQLCRNMTHTIAELDADIQRITRTCHTAFLQLESDQYVDEDLKNLGRLFEVLPDQSEDLSHHLRLRHMQYIHDREVAVTNAASEALGG